MNGSLNSIAAALVLSVAAPFCKGQAIYTNRSQGFSIAIPGTVDESNSAQAVYVLSSTNSDSTLVVGVMKDTKTVPKYAQVFGQSGYGRLWQKLSRCYQ